ncbi:MAG TPA: BTAD domain-containing putative transcriptional regulator [Actinoplanes sp.]
MTSMLGDHAPARRRLGVPWQLNLLGAWQLTGAEQPVDVGRNGQRLFALLAVRGPCDRSYVAGTLWSECSEPRARANLRATLSRLHRRCRADLLRSAGGVLSMRPEVEVDLGRLLATAAAVLDHGPGPPGRAALPVLTGPELLPGWYEDWILAERERVRQIRLHALETLSARLLADGDPTAAVDAAQASVTVEPLRESAHRAVIRAHLAVGNRPEALRHLDHLRWLLRVELGVEPSGLTTALLR